MRQKCALQAPAISCPRHSKGLIKKDIQRCFTSSGLCAGVIIAEMAAGAATFLHTLMGLIKKHTADQHL
jgi:hypothetical protein